jgi:predicted DNA-binding transcriptional regulator AlpA
MADKQIRDEQLLRVKQILEDYIPVGKSTWWKGVREGRFPQPIKLGPRTTVWKRSEILDLANNPEGYGKGGC